VSGHGMSGGGGGGGGGGHTGERGHMQRTIDDVVQGKSTEAQHVLTRIVRPMSESRPLKATNGPRSRNLSANQALKNIQMPAKT
jgi:hypothetical protein